MDVGTVFTYDKISKKYSAVTKQNQLIPYKKDQVEDSGFFEPILSEDQKKLQKFVKQMRDYWKGEGHLDVIEVGFDLLLHFSLDRTKEMIETIEEKTRSNYE